MIVLFFRPQFSELLEGICEVDESYIGGTIAMKKYTGDIIFFLVFLIFSFSVIALRLHWIHKAVATKAVVVEINKTFLTRIQQTYPVVHYYVDGRELQTTGTYNMPFSAGDSLDILYNPDNPFSFKVNTPFWLWFDIWSWYRVLLAFILIYYVARFVVRRSTQIS